MRQPGWEASLGGNGYIYVCIAESLCCSPKTITTLLTGYTQIQNTGHEFSRQEYSSGLPSPSPVDHIFAELSTMTHPSWMALHGMAHSFIELNKAEPKMEPKQKHHRAVDVAGVEAGPML